MNEVIEEDLQAIYEADIDWNQFSGKTVLVTGANGFLPAYLVRSLLYVNACRPALKIKIIALVRSAEKAKARFSDYLSDDALEILEQDVCVPIRSGAVDFIIHAASQASPKFYGTDPVGTLSANVLGTMNVLELARTSASTGVLYFSSGEVYGEVTDAHNPVVENYYGHLDPTNVRACYGESKRMGENMCVSYAHQYGVAAKIVRPFHTYGPGMSLDDGRVYADFVADILAGRNIQMKSDGSARRAFCYIKDATIGFLTVLLRGKIGEAYNVGNPCEEYAILELADIVAGLVTPPINVILNDATVGGSYLRSPILRNSPDISKIAGLGWQPVTSARQGFERTIRSYQ